MLFIKRIINLSVSITAATPNTVLISDPATFTKHLAGSIRGKIWVSE
jgi:hypothetical protein